MSTAPQQTAAAAGAATQEAPDLLDQVIAATRPQTDKEKERAREYFLQFLQSAVKPEQVVSKDVEQNIKYWIAEIDKKLSAQLNEVMHDPAFQKLEGSWRGLHYLVHKPESDEGLKIKVLNVNKKDLLKDLEKAVEFDQSTLFKKIYEEEYGQLGGEPYGMLVGDYEFSRTLDDVNMLKLLSGVAAMAHAPLVANASSKLFNMDRYTELTAPRDLTKIFQGVEYGAWKSFRDSEDSRYVALTMPRVLGRLPYGEDFKRVHEFNFEEFVDGQRPRQVPVDGRRVGLRGQHHRRLLASTAGWPARAASRAAARSRTCRSTPSPPTTATWRSSARPRSPSPTAASSSCPTSASCRLSTARTTTSPSSWAPSRARSRRRISRRTPTPTPSCRPSST